MSALKRVAAAAVVLVLAVAVGPADAGQWKQRLQSDFNSFFSGVGEEFNRITAGTTRTVVDFPARYKQGTIVVRTNERRLYYVVGKGKAYRYKVGVGREGFTWSGVSKVSRKAKWPSWRPPEEMLVRRPDLPKYMPGGPENPLGARALYLGDTLYRIHGTRASHTIGTAVSSGCIRMLNDDVIDLYKRVRIGATVHVSH